MSISGLPFVFAKVRVLLSVCKWKVAQGCEKVAKNEIRILCYRR